MSPTLLAVWDSCRDMMEAIHKTDLRVGFLLYTEYSIVT